MGKHAMLSASAAHRWMYCPGSVRLSEGLAETSSDAADEGTLAHEIAANALTDSHTPVVGTDEMWDAVRVYTDYLRSTRKEGDADRVDIDLTAALQTVDPDCGGTADFVRWRPKDKHLYVVDFKYGAGVLVNPEGNKQLLLYALGALIAVGKPAKHVTVVIIQPRIEHEDGAIREWTFDAKQLLSFAADVAESAARTREVNAPLVAGETQCRWCRAKRICPELEKRQHALIATEFKDLAPYDPAKLAQALDDIPLVEARIKALREFASAEAERGNPPPGYKLVAKRGVRKWIGEEAVRAWAEQRAIDAYEDPKLKSPAQLEKGLTKEQKAELAEMTVTVSSGHTLVPEADKRPAVHKALVSDFAVIPGTAETN